VAAWTGLLRLRIMRGREAPVNAVMNVQVPCKADNFLTVDLLNSQKKNCIMELFIHLFIYFVCQSVACQPVTMQVAFIMVGAG
jgi:hypothetical protein